MFKYLRIAILTLVSTPMFGQAPAPAQPAPPRPNCLTASYRQLDFWVGEWRVFRTVDNVEVASSRIESVMDGCGIKEYYDSPGAPGGHYTGTSYSSFDRKDGKWHQMYIDVNGSVGLFIGSMEGDDMAMFAPAPKGTLQKMVYRPLPGGAVEQIGTVSADNGKTWQPGYDYTYRRK